MCLERLLCSQGTLGRGRPIGNKKPKLPAPRSLQWAVLARSWGLPRPRVPQLPGGGRRARAIAAPRRTSGRPRGCHLQAAGRRAAPLPGPDRCLHLGEVRRAPPRRGPRRLSPSSPAASSRRRFGSAFLRVEQQLFLRRRLGRGQRGAARASVPPAAPQARVSVQNAAGVAQSLRSGAEAAQGWG